MSYEIKQDGKFKFIEEGEGDVLMLLHGLFGALSNFQDLIEHFRKQYKVVVPILPLLEMDLLNTTVGGLQKFVNRFIDQRNYTAINLLGNSLGGHVALVHILRNPAKIKSLRSCNALPTLSCNLSLGILPFIRSLASIGYNLKQDTQTGTFA